jgi:hypothetical protein
MMLPVESEIGTSTKSINRLEIGATRAVG